ncbi:hypothetical protein HR12_17395 [Microbacterium sp. SUBG005]|nr:hypothetical protein HR12_17395 [Microbacterium sp. SUBG005]
MWPVRRALTGESGTMLPAFVDHHVHLHLVDACGLPRRGIAAVVDLGGDPIALARRGEGLPHVRYAGAFLTVAGGYPVGRPWATRQHRPCRDERFPASGGSRVARERRSTRRRMPEPR